LIVHRSWTDRYQGYGYAAKMPGQYIIVIARLEPGDPVRRGISIYLKRLCNTGSPAFAEDDTFSVQSRPG
jgi:ethanolamine utilization microcompartment shell protein EutL